MKNWEQETQNSAYCPALIDLEDAQQVADELEIPLLRVNFSRQYWDKVFAHFLQEYQNGRTPNPDIICNKEIKFRAFLDYALQLGADFIATGHYVRRADIGGQVHLLTGLDDNKDQSYFLHTLSQQQLKHALFPIGDYQKSTVRAMAQQFGFDNHNKKDSTGICFIGERRFKDFLQQYLPAQVGDIVSDSGEILGKHDGLMYYTIGQRQGIGIGGRRCGNTQPWYVIGKNLEQNQLLVAQGSEHPALYHPKLRTGPVHWINAPPSPCQVAILTAKVRYRQTAQRCEISQLSPQGCEVVFASAQRAITAGQSIVFYANDDCLGGAIIEAAYY